MFEIENRDIVGYTHNGETLCRLCTGQLAEDIVSENCWTETPDIPATMSDTELLRMWAEHESIDTSRQDSFDSDDFPKPYESAEDDELCDHCGDPVNRNYHRSVR